MFENIDYFTNMLKKNISFSKATSEEQISTKFLNIMSFNVFVVKDES